MAQEFSWKHFLYVSNICSLVRIPCAIGFVYYLVPFDVLLVTIFAIVGVVSDYLDGLLARRLGQVTQLGVLLDPFADKVGLAIVGFGLLYADLISMWIVALVVTRDILIVLSVIVLKKVRPHIQTPMSNTTGKVAVNIITAGVLLQLVTQVQVVGQVLIVFAVAVSLISYYVRARQLLL